MVADLATVAVIGHLLSFSRTTSATVSGVPPSSGPSEVALRTRPGL